jgi:hypothetical protein
MTAIETTTDNTGVLHSDGTTGLEAPNLSGAGAIARSPGDDRMNPKSSASATAVLPALAIDTAASTSDKTPPPITTSDAGNDLTKGSVADLTNRMEAAKRLREIGRDGVKAVYEEEIWRAEDPARLKALTDQLRSNTTILDTGIDGNGKAINDDRRVAMLVQDVKLIEDLSAGAQLHKEYAKYLAGDSLARPTDSPRPIRDSLDSPQGADAQLRLAIKDADQVDADLIKRTDRQVVERWSHIFGGSAELDRTMAAIHASQDWSGNRVAGLADLRVTLRDDLAVQYLNEDLENVIVAPAVHLLEESRAAYETLHGEGVFDQRTEQLMASAKSMGHQPQD